MNRGAQFEDTKYKIQFVAIVRVSRLGTYEKKIEKSINCHKQNKKKNTNQQCIVGRNTSIREPIFRFVVGVEQSKKKNKP